MMLRNVKWLVVVFACMLASIPVDAQRKRVAVVLSGGGAKGVAHVGALRVLEEAGIPVDYIVGTSMGSIIGGLYAIGYSAVQLDSMIQAQDWEFLLSDKVYRYDLPFTEKENDGKYLLSVSFDLRDMKKGQRGFVSGHNVYNLFSDLTVGYHDSLDFSTLPIPFACVAADMVHREEVVFHGGNLVQAMRASMAIPGAFTPVRLGDKVLVDGGVLNNFPVDVALAMGAEVVIGVDVQADLMKAEQLGNVSTVLAQMINLMCMNKYQDNLARADLVIRPNVKGYSSASFGDRAIDTLLVRGEVAARKKWDELIALREYIGGSRETSPTGKQETREVLAVRNIYIRGVEGKEREAVEHRLRVKANSEVTMTDIHRTIAELYGTKAYAAVNYRLLGKEAPYDLELSLMPQSSGAVNVGFRFDSEEMAAILLNTTYRRGALRGGQLSLTGSLSKNPWFRAEYSLENTFLRRFNLAYTFQYNDINFYQKGEKTNNITFRYHAADLSMSNLYFRNLRFSGGIRYEYFDYNSLLFIREGDIVKIKPRGVFSYYGLVHWETLDRRFYPTEGVLARVDYSLFTDNLLTYKDGTPFSALSWHAMTVLPLTSRLSLLPAFYGRVLIGNNLASPCMNCVGGTSFGKYVRQQLPFAGINHVEVFENSVVVARLHFRQRMGSKHYLSLVGNYALQDNDFGNLLNRRGIWGGALGYSRDSRIGPIDLVFSYSDWSKKPEYYFNFGFYF